MALCLMDKATVLSWVGLDVVTMSAVYVLFNICFVFPSSGNKPDRYLHRVAASGKSPQNLSREYPGACLLLV